MSGLTAPGARVAVGLLLACAVVTAALAMGLRQSLGLFLAPMTQAHGWSASGFAFAIALQVLVNGLTQPLWGQMADRIGGRTVIMIGASLQVVALIGMALSDSLVWFTFFAGVVMGCAVSAAGMPVVMASLTRLLPDSLRGRATGLGTAGSSFGQFLVVPLVAFGISGAGWQVAMLIIAGVSLFMIPLALPLNDQAAKPAAGAPAEEKAGVALRRALGDPTFWFLSFGFFVCGVHVSFMAVHLPGFVASCHLPLGVGAAAISLIGLFNVAGSLTAGELSSKWKRRELLVIIYAARGVLMGGFMMVEKTTTSVLVFSAIMGLLWLSTVPPTVALCARNFGTRWLATIFGLVFLGHQVGGFTGAWLGGVIFDQTGSYDRMWLIAVIAAFAGAIFSAFCRDGAPTAKAPPVPVGRTAEA